MLIYFFKVRILLKERKKELKSPNPHIPSEKTRALSKLPVQEKVYPSKNQNEISIAIKIQIIKRLNTRNH